MKWALAAAAILFCVTTAQSQIRKESELQERLAKTPLTFFVAYGHADACGPGCQKWIAVEGQFDKGSTERFAAFVKRFDASQLPIFLNSMGGLTDEGIAFGRFLRSSGMRAGVALTQPDCADQKRAADCKATMAAGGPIYSAWTSSNALCSSACVFALIGATARSVPPEVKLGIHSTTYFCFREDGRVMQPVGNSKDAIECRKKITARARRLTRYIAEMGISLELVYAMNNVPGSQIRYLAHDEMKRYGIENADAVLESAKGQVPASAR